MCGGIQGVLFLAAVSTTLTVSHMALAQGSSSSEERQTIASDVRQPSVPRRWYGWQTFSADGIAAGFFFAGVADDHNAPLLGVSGVTFAVGAPVVHLSHGQWEMALGSVGLRVVGPLLGAVIGSTQDGETSSDTSGGNTSAKWTTTGVAIGGLVASAVDGLLLAYDARPGPISAPVRNQLLKIELSPHLALTPHGLAIGLSGSL